MAVEKKRQSNIELLRIISMLMIIGLHLLDKGKLLPSVKGEWNTNGYVAWMLEAFFLSSVNVFFLISGYFGINIKLSAKKILYFWMQVAFYSIIFGFIAVAIGIRTFDIYTCFQYIFPLVTDHYWFATVYIILLVISPLLNKGVEGIEKKTFQLILVVLIVFGSVAKTFIPMNLPTDELGYNVTWMITIYLTGMYIRKYGAINLRKWQYMGIYVASSLMIFISMLFVRTLYVRKGILENFITWGYSYNFLFCFIASVALFVHFLKIPEFKGVKADYTNKIAGVTFGVYLFHEHIDIRYLWPKALNVEAFAKSNTVIFILQILVTLIVVFALGALIESIRKRLFNFRQNIDLFLVLIILLYALRNCFKGIDLMDASYSLGNYKYYDIMNPTWRLATFLSSVLGMLLMKLPGGELWIGMNLYTGLLLAAVAIGVYKWLTTKYQAKKWIVFIGVLLGLSLCWAPSVILYQYLGFIIMNVTVMILIDAITRQKTIEFVLAGVLLGLAVFVRMPNITYVILIVPVLYGVYLYEKKKVGIRFLQCVGGFLLGAVPVYLYICIRYGVGAYSDMISSLFGMTTKATDYKPTAMITDIFEAFIIYSPWLLLFAGYAILGIIIFKFIKLKKDIILKVLYIIGFIVVIRFSWGRGYMGLDYSEFFAVVKPVTTYVTAVIIFCIYNLISKKIDKEWKILSAFLIVMIFVSPLGGNNHIYSIMQNMIFVFPASLLLIEKFDKEKKNFPLSVVTRGFIILLMIQCFAFGNKFVFHDMDGANSTMIESSISTSKVTSGLLTSETRNTALVELGKYLEEDSLLGQKVLLYGNIPGISYIFEMTPAVYTTWPDLDSNVYARLKKDLDELKITPVIITSKEVGKRFLAPLNIENDKEKLIADYMQQNGYHCSFFNDEFYVYVCE